MNSKALLTLEDGSCYEGSAFGSIRDAVGEVVFTTGITGYQETLTDPSHAGQIVVPTYPLIGNYGTNEEDAESGRVQVSGLIVREYCNQPSHYRSTGTLNEYLSAYNIPAIAGLDTRALARKLRSNGTMMGIITSGLSVGEALEKLKHSPRYENEDWVSRVSTRQPYSWPQETAGQTGLRIIVLDCGIRNSLVKTIASTGVDVNIVPPTLNAQQILSLNPDGLVISPGPGNPEMADNIVDTIRRLLDKIPIMGISLGHQLIARAFGAKTYKMKFGHRGMNQPVLELETGRVHITSQNHGWAVDADTLKDGLEVSFTNLNDGTVEGLTHNTLPVFSVQYHSENSSDPFENAYLFTKFINIIRQQQNNRRCF
jgi:carbamoyl-phosphate synthase small subunit